MPVRRQSLRTCWRHAKATTGRVGTVPAEPVEALKGHESAADTTDVRLERLVIDAGERSLATEFHPKLTVIGGLSPTAREAAS